MEINRRRALQREGEARGKAIREARADRDDLCGRTPGEVRELREQSAKSATVCADCFEPLSPTASVTMASRPVLIPADTDWQGRPVPEFYDRRRVPICLTCWLINLQCDALSWTRDGLGGDQHENELLQSEEIRRLRCLGCGRPLRVDHPRRYSRGLHLSEQVCCRDCARVTSNQRNRLRRRVEHAKVKCAICKKPFIQKRSDAKTCSNRCRQKMFRRSLVGR